MPSSHSVAGLMKWLRREEWREGFESLLKLHISAACDQVDIEIDDLVSLIGADLFTAVWGCVFEDFLTREDEAGQNIVDDYLKRRGWKENAVDRAYMAALRISAMSLYEVSEVVPGESFLARDLVRGGDPVLVRERTATRQMKSWDRIAARVVTVASRNVMGGGVLPFDREPSETVLKRVVRALEKGRKEAAKQVQKHDQATMGLPTDAGLLQSLAPTFTEVWLGDVLERVLNPQRPEVRNSEDHELVFTAVHYALAPGVTIDAIRTALRKLPALREESGSFWNWVDQKTPSPSGRARGSGPGRRFVTTMEDGSLVLGNIEVRDNALILSANSRERAERGQALLGPVLAGLVRIPLVETQTIEQVMASRPRVHKAPSSPVSPEEERSLIHSNLDRYYRNLLDETVPMLGNVTPRRAAKTIKGREKLVAWLKYMENQAANQQAGTPMADYDFSWLWDELGIADLRR